MALPSDLRSNGVTHDASAIPLEWLRKATPGERAALAVSLSAAAIIRSRNEIRRLHPDFTEEQLGIEFVAVHYGRELADEVAVFLADRRRSRDAGE